LITCSSCHTISADPTCCSTTSTYINKEKFASNPIINHAIRIEPQIGAILERNHLITPNQDKNIIRDIVDASFYRKIYLFFSSIYRIYILDFQISECGKAKVCKLYKCVQQS
jgi:hypothetical protein